MEERATGVDRWGRWPEGCCLALLVLLAAGIRVWLVSHTTVPARDSIGFIRYAWQLQHQPWQEVLRTNQQAPVYPLAILAASVPVRYFMGGSEPVLMQFSAQLASAAAGVLLVLPMFFLGRSLFHWKVGFWSAALWQCLPVAVRVTSDALSEGVFLLLVVTALALAVRALQTRSVIRFCLCGLCGGLAYLTRPEGMLVVVATALVLLAAQASPAWRRPWRKTLLGAAGLVVSALLVGSPYVAVTGRLTNKPTARQMIGNPCPGESEDRSETGTRPTTPALAEEGRPAAGPPVASTLAVWHPHWRHFDITTRLAGGLWILGDEIIKSFHYVAWLPALLGLWWWRRRTPALGGWVLLLLCLFHALAVWGVAVVRGYVSERHTLILVLCGTFWAVAALSTIGQWLTTWAFRERSHGLVRRVPVVEVALLLAVLGLGLPEVFKPLHANRASHRAAGLWLADHTDPADTIVDPFCWAHYYAGRVFQEGTPVLPAPGYRPQCYVVVEHSRTEHGRMTMVTDALKLAEQGALVFRDPSRRPRDPSEEVLIYRLPPQATNSP